MAQPVDPVVATTVPVAARRLRLRLRPHISVCIANWNCKELLRTCLLSLDAAVQKVRIEVIVFDNASTDALPTWWSASFPTSG